jgi:hypothetical protein
MIDPSRDCWITRSFSLRNAWIDMINSVALPKVAFRRPPTATKCGEVQAKSSCMQMQFSSKMLQKESN